MEVVNLPQDIFPGTVLKPDGILIHDYLVEHGTFKGKAVLHKNAISLVIQGEKKMHFAEQTVVAKDDEFHFLSAGNCIASIDLFNRKVFRSVLVFFSDKVLADFYLKYDSVISRIKGRKEIAPMAYISLKKDAFIHNYISSVLLLTGRGNPVSEEMKLLKFEELMLHLLEKYPASILSFQPEPDSALHFEIRKVVETNITNNLGIEELAFLCNLSLSTFKRRFAHIYGTSPNKWLLQRRMEMAAGLLKSHSVRPGEVFQKVGYQNHSSFTQSFKQIFGVTPREYQLQGLNARQHSLNEKP